VVTRLTQHGNGAALVIDKAVSERLRITMKTPLALATDGRNLIISPVREAKQQARFRAALEAVNRGAVRHLYLLKTFAMPGRVCDGCGALGTSGEASPQETTCRFCGQGTRGTELGEAMVDRVAATGGRVSVLERHTWLAERDGIAARLRYAA